MDTQHKKHLTASQITEMALKELSWRGCEVWRQNQVKVPGRKFTGKRGLADIIGFHKRSGLMVMCEVKTITDKFSPEQILLLSQLQQAGGISMFATENDKGNFELKDYKL